MVVFKSQCDQIGLFSKVPDIKLSYKSMVTLGLFWKTSLLRKTIVGNFWKCMEYFLFQPLVTLSKALVYVRKKGLERERYRKEKKLAKRQKQFPKIVWLPLLPIQLLNVKYAPSCKKCFPMQLKERIRNTRHENLVLFIKTKTQNWPNNLSQISFFYFQFSVSQTNANSFR